MRRTKPIKKGDYFLLPYRGARIDLLIQVCSVRGIVTESTTYKCRSMVSGHESYHNLDGCRRIGPKLAKAILQTKPPVS